MFPLFCQWDAIALSLARHYQNVNILYFDGTEFFISLMIKAAILFIFVILGAHRLRMFVPAAFVFGLFQVGMITVNLFIAAVFFPLVDLKNLYEVCYKFPHIFYISLFLHAIITTSGCLLAARWLRNTKIKPPFRFYSFFSMVFIIFSFAVIVWWININKDVSLPLPVFTFLGALLLGILLLLFYLYIVFMRLTGADNRENNVINETEKAKNYSHLIQQLSRREQEVIEAIAAGNKRYKELAGKLNISVHTVKFHLRNIYQITGVSNLTALSNLLREFTSSGK
ncbi:MAG: helix-turn-helix transcriptional regulator [Treponema sp.]|nr:helix-turn-helix transcriptional regulator [Treponema sp.]